MSVKKKLRALVFQCGVVWLGSMSWTTIHAASGDSASIVMSNTRWALGEPAAWIPDKQDFSPSFARYEGMPSGTMTIRDEAIVVSKDVQFKDGTIDFDIKPLEYSDTGIVFRRNGNESGEFVYLRANPDCPAADDCIQYVPINHGLMPWNIYSADQGQAPISAVGWNHLHLVVAGARMKVFVNRLSEPSLVISDLGADRPGNGIAFKGPAVYANLVVERGGALELNGIRDPALSPETVISWSAAPPTALPSGRKPTAADIPVQSLWQQIKTGGRGLIDLGRVFGSAMAPAVSTAWLRFTVVAENPGRRIFNLGWAGQVNVFLNGNPVYNANNFYFPPEHRLSVNGRLEPDNASIPLDLKQGENQVVVAVNNLWHTSAGGVKPSPYGWGVEGHFALATGLRIR